MASKVNALSYMRNVGKSLGYSIIDNLNEMNPVVASLAATTKEQTQNLYHGIKDFKATAKDFGNTGPLADAKEIGKDTWNNLLSDLKSGNWYNKARIDKVSEDVMGEAFGINFDDFGDFDDDFNFDEDFEDETNLEQESIKKTAQVIDAVGQKTSAAIASASVHSADYIVKNNRANSKALFDLNSKGFSTVISGISAMNANMGVLVEMGKPLTEHMQNSALFYAKTNEYQEQSLALLKQIAANTTPKNESNMRKASSGGLNLIDLINSDGTINFANVKRAAKEGYENSMLGLMTSMLGMMGGVKGAAKMFAASPLQMVMNTLTGSFFNIKGSRGRTARDAMGNFNDILAGFMPAMLGKFQAADIDKMKVPELMKTLLRGVRGNLPSSGLTKKVNTGNYVKGPVDWDGMSRKALMDVIPTQLAKILSALTGEDPEVFDYKTGRWVKARSINKMNRERTNRYGDQAGGELFSEIRRSIKNSSTMSKRGKKEYDAQIQSFLNQLMLSDDADFMRFIGNGDFDVNKYKDYINPELLKDLRARARKLAQSNSKYTNTYARNMYTARASYGKEMRNLGGSGDVTEMLYNGAFGDLNDTKKKGSMSLHNQRKLKPTGTGGISSSLMYAVDEYDHNMFYYAQEIHKDVNFIASNLDMLVAGGRPVGAREDGKIDFKPRIVLRPKETSEAARRNIPKSVIKPKKNVQTGPVDEVLNNGRDPKYDGFSEKEIEYMKAKEKGDKNFKYDQAMEDSIKAKQDVQNIGKNTKQKIGDTYGKIKGNKFVGKHVENLENLAGVSTDAVVNILDAASQQINNFMYGTGKEGDTSFVQVLKDSFGGMFKQMAKTITDLIPQPIKDLFSGLKKLINQNESYRKFKSGVKSTLRSWGKGLFKGWAGRQEEKVRNNMVDSMYSEENKAMAEGKSNEELWAEMMAGQGSGIYNFYDRLNREYDSTYSGYAGGGSYDYDEPVIIPFNRNRARSRRRRTSGGASGHYRSADDDAAAGPRRKKPSKATYNAYKRGKAQGMNATDAYAEAQNDPRVAAERVVNKAANKIADWFSEGLAQLVGGKKPEDEREELNKSINSKMRQMLGDAGANKEALGAGAVVGAGTSLITGAFLGPIAGAAIGASVAFVAKSETAQKVLFGDIDEEGNRKGGVFNKKWSNFLTKNVPQMGKGAALGGAAGLLFGSPVLGAVLGSAAGYVASSEQAKEWLFGKELEDGTYKEGKIPKKLQDYVKAKAPWALAGGAAGLLIGPFGPMGNLVAGSMLGLASQTDTFRKWMFGDKDGKFGEGGLTKLIQDKLLNPIVDLFKNMTSAITEKLKEVTHDLGKRIRQFILKRLGAKLMSTKAGKKVAETGKKLAKGAFNLLTSPVRGVSNAMRKHNIRAGRTAYLNGEEMDVAARQKYREENMLFGGNAIMEGFDRDVLSGIANDNEALANYKDILERLYDPTKEFERRYADNRSKLTGTFNKALEGRDKNTDKEIRKIYSKYLKKGNHISQEEADEAVAEIRKLESKGVDNETVRSLVAQVTKLRDISRDQDESNESNGESARNAIFRHLDEKNPLKRYYDNLRAEGGTLTDTELSRMMGLIDVEMKKNNKIATSNQKTPDEENRDINQENLEESKQQTGIFISIKDLLHGIAKKLDVDPNILSEADKALEETQERMDETGRSIMSKAGEIIDEATEKADEAADIASKATIETGKTAKKVTRKAKKAASKAASKATRAAKKGAKKAGQMAVKGVAKGVVSMFGGGDSGLADEDNPDVDAAGEDNVVRDQYGNEVTNTGSTEAKKNAANEANFFAGMATIPMISSGVSEIIGKMDHIAASLYDDIGNDKKKGLLSSLKDMLVGENGVLGGLVKFFTGGKLEGVLSTLGTFKTAMSAFIGPAIGTAILAGALSGKLDPLWSKLGLAGKSNKEKGVDSNSSWTGMTAKDENGNEQAVAMDENGKPVTDEDGNYISTSGEKLKKTTVKYTESGATDSLSQRTRKSAVRAGVTGLISKATGNSFSKGSSGAFAKTAKSLGKSWTKAGAKAMKVIEKNPAALKIVTKLGELLGKLFDKLKGAICKVAKGVDESVAGQALNKFKRELIKSIQEKAEKSGSELLKKATADLAKTAAIILKVAMILWDFEEGFNNASANWGVAEPTLGQKIGSGIVHVILNLIPVVGLFIPESLLFKIYGNLILPIFDKEGAAKLKEQKAAADEELRKYNEENGTNYTWAEYTKQVKGNYTWGERIGNGVRSIGTNVANFFTGGKKTAQVEEAGTDTAIDEAEASGGASGILKKAAKTAFNLTPVGIGYNAGKKLTEMVKNNPISVMLQDLHAIRMKLAPEEASETSGGASGMTIGQMGSKAFDMWKKYTPYGMAYDKFTNSEFGQNIMQKAGQIGSKAVDLWGKYTPQGIAFNKLKNSKLGQEVQKASSKVLSTIKGKIAGFAGDIADLSPQEILNLQMNELKNLMRDTKDATIASSVASGASEYIDNVSSDMRKKLSTMTSKLQAKMEAEAEAVESGGKGGLLSKIFGLGKSIFGSSNEDTSGGSTGMVSQRDPKYAGMNIGGRSVGDMGCGPASAVNALNALGMHSSMSSAVSNANKYQTSGGTDITYFADEFKRNGADASYVSGRSMIDSVASGRPTVLMGQDRSNTSKEFSPFGPRNHYVVANGINSDGSVNISDPESRGVRRYSPSILNSVKMGVAAGRSGIRLSKAHNYMSRLNNNNRRFLKRFSAGASGDSRASIWRYLIEEIKMSEYGAAGLMGCWQAESHNTSTRIEGDYLKSFPGYDAVAASNDTLDNYTLNILFPAYEKSGLSINQSAYLGADGHYYPGFGLAQWTGPRTYNLIQFAKQSGGDWRSLDIQLKFACQELQDKYASVLNDLNAAGSIEDATTIAFRRYEGCKGHQSWLDERINYAKDIYNSYSGKTYTGGIFDGIDTSTGTSFVETPAGSTTHTSSSGNTHGGTTGTVDSSSKSTTGTSTSDGEKLTFGNALGKIMSVFTSAFTGAMFGKKNSDSSSSSKSGSTTHTSSSGTTHGGSNGTFSSGTAAQGDVANNFPYFNQGEEPWGPMPYTSTGNASQTIKTSGCGPTSMAMVMKSYGVSTDPSLTAQYSLDHGYRTANSGTSWGFFGDIGQNAGLEVTNFGGVDTAKKYLDDKIPVIASMGPGTFTKGGHYVVFSGKDGENVTVNDPASRQRTGNTYDADFALKQAKNFWAVSKDGKGSIGTYGLSDNMAGSDINTDNYYTNVTGVGMIDPKGRVVDPKKIQTIPGVGRVDQYGHVINSGSNSDKEETTTKKTVVKPGATKTNMSAQGSGLIDYRASRAGLRLLRDNTGRFSAGGSGDIPSFNGNRQVGLGRFSQSMFGNMGGEAAISPQNQAEINKATMSKDTAAMLKVIIDLVSNVVTNTSTLSEILEVVKQLCSASGNPELHEAAKGIENAPSSFVQRTGVNDATLASLNDLRSLVDQVLAS